jgi:hypothetical protein
MRNNSFPKSLCTQRAATGYADRCMLYREMTAVQCKDHEEQLTFTGRKLHFL